MSSKEKKDLFKEYNFSQKQYKKLLTEQDWDLTDYKSEIPSTNLWKINKSSGDCELSNDIEAFYICLDSYEAEDEGDLTDNAYETFGDYVINMGHAQCCDAALLSGWETFEESDYEDVSGFNTISDFMLFAGGGCGDIDDDVDLNYLLDPDPDNGFAYYYSTECPSCLPDEFPGAPYDTPPNVVDGNNWPTLPSNGGWADLTYVQDGSCEIEACSQRYWDNYFCTLYPLLCTISDNLCNGNCGYMNSDYGFLTDDGTCSYTGCVDVPSNANYVCTLWPALCPGTSAMNNYPDNFNFQMFGDEANPTNLFGIPGGYNTETYINDTNELQETILEEIGEVTGTFNNNNELCTETLGCTNSLFTNYNLNADNASTTYNIDDGGCLFSGCANTDLSWMSVYVCNLYSSLCDDDGNFVTTYEDGLQTGLNYTGEENFIYDDAYFDETANDGEGADVGTCVLKPGCTNPIFGGANGNYEGGIDYANYDDGSCLWTGCLDPNAPNYVCKVNSDLCDVEGTTGIPITEYEGIRPDGIVDWQADGAPTMLIPSDAYTEGGIIQACTDCCGAYGCMDNGNMGQAWWDATYAGQTINNLTLPDTYPGNEPDDEETGFQPVNYCADCTVDPMDEGGVGDPCNYDSNGSGVIDTEDIEGCISPINIVSNDPYSAHSTATNHSSIATVSTNCNYIVFGCTDDGNKDQDWWEGNGDPIAGTTQTNFQYTGTGNMRVNVTDYSSISYLPTDYPDIDVCVGDGTGENDITENCVTNYNSLANVDDGSCTYNLTIYGCMDDSLDSYDSAATEDISYLGLGDEYDWSGNPCGYTYGCLDENSDNYDSSLGANLQPPDGQGGQEVWCTYTIQGCTEATAVNYDSSANIEDGTCRWSPTSITTQGYGSFVCGQPLSSNQTSFSTDVTSADTNTIQVSSGSIYLQANNGYLIGPQSVIGNSGQTMNAVVGDISVGTTLQSQQNNAINGDTAHCEFVDFCLDSDSDDFICNNDDYSGLCTWEGEVGSIDYDNGTYPAALNDTCGVEAIMGCMDPNAANYSATATQDDINEPGYTRCWYNGYCNDTSAWNAGCLNAGCTNLSGSLISWTGGSSTIKPQYQAVIFDGTTVTYGGGSWQDDDIPDSTICGFEGCGSSTITQTFLANAGMPTMLYPPAVSNEDGLSTVSDNPQTELGIYSSLDSDVMLYAYNSQNAGCDPDEDGIPDADDYSCCPIPGCMDSAAQGDTGTGYQEYHNLPANGGNAPEGTDEYNNGCYYSLGCINDMADNYDPYAYMDDGSCVIYGCTYADASNYWCDGTTTIINDPESEDDDEIVNNDCDPDIPLTEDDYAVVGYVISDSGPNAVYVNPYNDAPTICEWPGCTDPTYIAYWDYDADNFTITSPAIVPNVDDGSCGNQQVIYGCTWTTMEDLDGEIVPTINYDELATVDDGSCEYTVYGCPDSTACNYDSDVNTDDGSCYWEEEGFDCWGNPVDPPILGCIDVNACNYDSNAEEDDGSCWYPESGEDCEGICLSDTDDDGICIDDDEWPFDPTNGEACWDVVAVRCGDPMNFEYEFPCMRIEEQDIYVGQDQFYNPDSELVKQFRAPGEEPWAFVPYAEPGTNYDISYDIGDIECHWCPGLLTGAPEGGPVEGYWYLGSPALNEMYATTATIYGWDVEEDGQPSEYYGEWSFINFNQASGITSTNCNTNENYLDMFSSTFGGGTNPIATTMNDFCAELGFSGVGDPIYSGDFEEGTFECGWCPGFTAQFDGGVPDYNFEGYWYPLLTNDELTAFGITLPYGEDMPWFAEENSCQNYMINGYLYGGDGFSGVLNQIDDWNGVCGQVGYTGNGTPENTGVFGSNPWWTGIDPSFEYNLLNTSIGNYNDRIILAEHCPWMDPNNDDFGFVIEVEGGMGDNWCHNSNFPTPTNCFDIVANDSYDEDGYDCGGAEGNIWNNTSYWCGSLSGIVSWYDLQAQHNDKVSYLEVPEGMHVVLFGNYLWGAGVTGNSTMVYGPWAGCLTELPGWNANDQVSAVIVDWPCINHIGGDGNAEWEPIDQQACLDNYNLGLDISTEGIIDPDDNIGTDSDGDGIPDWQEIPGCTDPTAENYNEDATDDDGSCEFDPNMIPPEASCGGEPGFWQYPDLCGICNGTNNQCNGCTDPTAGNYDSNAVLDCQFDYNTLNLIDPLHLIPESEGGLNPYTWEDIEYPMWTQPFFSHINNQIGNDIVSGNTCCDYTFEPEPEDEEDLEEIPGCTDENAANYDSSATVDDGSCEIEGCTDESACNYNADANTDDGSCDYSCLGCTDETADNYDSEATIDDGSCEYGPEEFDDTQLHWAYFGSSYDNSCKSTDPSSGGNISYFSSIDENDVVAVYSFAITPNSVSDVTYPICSSDWGDGCILFTNEAACCQSVYNWAQGSSAFWDNYNSGACVDITGPLEE